MLRARYRIRAELSRGGMGAVYLAEDTNLADSLCAVKQMLNLGAEMNEYVEGRFLAEMQVLIRLRHPGIPTVRDFFQEAEGSFIVMDYIQGQTLEQEMEAHRAAGSTYPNPQAVSDMLVVLDVLSYLHGQSPQLLHRDIKPANLIRETNTGKLTVVDFGLARNLEENQSALHTSVGTLGYSALEQLTGKPEVRSDLYSVGVTLHEMVSGIRPTLAGVEALTPKTMANFDPALSSIIARATDQDVQKRFASAEEFRQALLGWQGGKTVAIPAPVRPASPKRRRMTPVLLIVLLLAGAVLWRLAAHHSPSPTRSDPGLQGDIFASRPEGRTSVVGLGEDVGLFWIEEANPKVTAKRAQTVVQRLNYLYHHQCLECGAFLLEPAGIRVGRFQQKETDELVVFYAHMHGNQYAYGPELLVTVDVPLARRLGATPRYVAGYWRNLIRDVVALSRGESSQQSPLGPTFAAVVTDLRQKGSEASLARLRAAVSALSSSQASLLQNAFRKVPEDFRFESDPFPEKAGFKPLVN